MRSDHLEEFGGALREANVAYTDGSDEEGRKTLIINDVSTDFIGQLAYSTGVPLNELSLKRASLEDAFMRMTGEDVQYHASTPGAGQPNQPNQPAA